MKYTVVIVEDEVHQQQRLVKLLNSLYPELLIVGVTPNIDEAYRKISDEQPDLVFLDVMLPPNTSFELLDMFSSIRFDIIFTTSYEEFAVRAFRLSATDYLIKPLVEDELRAAVDKFLERKRMKSTTESLSVLLSNLKSAEARQKKIALPTLSGYIFVAIDDIVRCESDNTYTTFFLRDKRRILISKTLKECENLLSEFSFFRVHHSNLVNLDHIVAYEKGDGGVVKLIDGSSVDVSRRKKEEFVRKFRKVGTHSDR